MTYYRDNSNHNSVYWQRDKHIDQWKRTESRLRPTEIWPSEFLTMAKK